MIYLVEDDNAIRELVIYTLNMAGYEAIGFSDAKSFFDAVSKEVPKLVLLDIMLPDEDGISILRKLRGKLETASLPIIMLTAKGSEYDKVLGLDNGADDYITKPFGMMELVSRIRALLRRSSYSEGGSAELTLGDIRIDIDRHSIYLKGSEVALTLKEYELLKFLMEHQYKVLSRNQLLEAIWGYDFDGETRTVDVHIRGLRQKLGDSGDLIETVRGVGYRMGGPK